MASVHWVIIGSGNGLLPVWQKAFTWIISAILLIRPWWTYFNEILFEIQISSINKFLIVVCKNNKKTIKRLHFKLSYVRNRLFLFRALHSFRWFLCTVLIDSWRAQLICVLHVQSSFVWKTLAFHIAMYSAICWLSNFIWQLNWNFFLSEYTHFSIAWLPSIWFYWPVFCLGSWSFRYSLTSTIYII